MSVYLDSANPRQVERALALGFIAGVTTNPILIAREEMPRLALVDKLLAICPTTLFCQLESHSLEEMREEAVALYTLAPDRIVIKIPCTVIGLSLVAELSSWMTCAITAIFSPAQAILAAEAGAQYVIPYVNRTTRLMGDGISLVAKMAQVCRMGQHNIQVLAGSLKSVDEVVEAQLNGADHVTVPFDILMAMADHPLSQQAIAEFTSAAEGK
ncbi:MAG: transaldolase [Anaerolineae bacterium]|nr:transaldolase [Anaerolineae bacterium]